MSGQARILWLAAADARGHLMRAHLMRQGLARRGVEVDLLTTSDEGQRFLAAVGSPSAVLSRSYRVEFDAAQNMDRRATDLRVARYLALPTRFLRDLAVLRQRGRGAALVVNDFHPALLVAGGIPALRGELKVVHVHGENLREAILGNYEGRSPGAWSGFYRHGLSSLFAGAAGAIEHTLAPSRPEQLPPIFAAPRRGRSEVRRALGARDPQPLWVVYLNPHFRDPAIAAAIESAAAGAGCRLHAVGEGYAERAGWRATDPWLADAIAAADLFLSAPGMGALGQALAFATPFIALVTDQPEQRANLRFLAPHPCHASLPVHELGRLPALVEGRLAAGAGLSRRPASERAEQVQALWQARILSFLEAPTLVPPPRSPAPRSSHEPVRAHRRPRAGDQQPARTGSGS